MTNSPMTKHIIEILKLILDQQKTHPKDSTLYTRISSIKAIEATQAALEAYLDAISYDKEMIQGKVYLYIYGVLQALFVQQNAVRYLCFSFGINYPENNVDLINIREIRNDQGHPADRKTKDKHKYSLIFDISPFADQYFPFTVYLERNSNVPENATNTLTTINVPDLIKKQNEIFIDVLANVLKTLQKENKT